MFAFARIRRPQFLSVAGWSSTDLTNRTHHGQVALAFGLTLPAENGVYIGPDCFAVKLTDALVVDGGFTRAQAAQFVLSAHDRWWHGLERIEWPNLFPIPEAMIYAPTPLGLAEGKKEFPPDREIYLAIATNPDGAFQVECGTTLENLVKRIETIRTAHVPTVVRQIHLRTVYDATLAAAAKAGVELGARFTRPEKHSEHREWFAAVEVHRALSAQRLKVRKPPGPVRAKPKAKKQASKKLAMA